MSNPSKTETDNALIIFYMQLIHNHNTSSYFISNDALYLETANCCNIMIYGQLLQYKTSIFKIIFFFKNALYMILSWQNDTEFIIFLTMIFNSVLNIVLI